jgi:hypothetical protein
MPPKPILGTAAIVILTYVVLVLRPESLITLRGEGAGINIDDIARVVLSLLLFLGALWVILSQRYTATDRHWAFGAVGTVIGFWFHM